MEQPLAQGGGGLEYAVVMVLYEDLTDGHEHVSHVDALGPDGVQRRWRLADLIQATRAGDRFLVTIGGTRTATTLEPSICPVCPVMTVNYRSR